jgi:hypothetical protein
MNKNKIFSILIIAAIGSIGILMSSCKGKSMDGNIIFTRIAGKTQNANLSNGDSWRYNQKAQIVVVDPIEGAKSLKVLSEDFYSAQSPTISYDGKHMLFTGQQKQNDPWQIWEMDLGNLKTKQITATNDNCADPVYLPNGRLLFSCLNAKDSLKAGHSLFTCNLDGSELKRITFNPNTYFASTILADGRVLTITKQLYPQTGGQMFMIMRPDGTKAEMFYQGISGSSIRTHGRQTSDGKIVFIESLNDKTHGGKLISISYNRPLNSRIDLAPEMEGDFRSVYPNISGKFLVSYRKTGTDKYGLFEFDPLKKVIVKTMYVDPQFDVIDAVVVERKDRPKKLPSEVDMEVKTGLLLCQNINVFQMQSPDSVKCLQKASAIEVLGLDSSLGIIHVEEDGSFYLKVMADKAFRIQTIDKEGHVLQGPSSWIWLRPNERRGCVGCHEDPELVPENKVPMSVKKSPVIIPVHINKMVEKNILLE